MAAVRYAELMNEATMLLKEGQDVHSSSEFWYYVLVGFGIWGTFIVLACALKYCTLRFVIWWRIAFSEKNIERWNSDISIDRLRYRMQDAVRDATEQMTVLFTGGIRACGNLYMFVPMLTLVSVAIEKETGYANTMNWSVFSWGSLGVIVAFSIGWKLTKLEYQNSLNEGDFGSPWEDLQKGRDGFVRLKRQLIDALDALSQSYKTYHAFAAILEIWLTLYQMGWVFIPLFGLGWFVFKGTISLGVMAQMKSALDEINNAISFIPNAMLRIAKLFSDLRLLRDFERFNAQKVTEQGVVIRVRAD
jgi:ABC-type long-subunit fatty acid transport system fused permease/ATPase subunit